MTPTERRLLLLVAGYIAELEGSLAADAGKTSPWAERLRPLIETIKAESSGPIDETAP